MKEPLAVRRLTADLPGVRVVFAAGSVLDLPAELETLGLSKVFVVTTGGRSAALVPPRELLGELLVGSFERAREHVPIATIEPAVARFRACDADVCVTIGGGSAIGLGKAIARETGAPLAAIPTTYSGSEMTSVWGQTGKDGKQTGRDPLARPRLVIYDVTLTLGLPAAASAASGMNAMAHAVEALYADNASDATKTIAEEAVQLLAGNLPAVVKKGSDLTARSGVLAAAHLAGRALEESAMGLHHRICHVLGGLFGLPHARTHAAVLPHVVAFNAPAAADAMERLGRALGSADVAAAIDRLNRDIGLTATLRDLGLRDRDLDRAAEEVAAAQYPNPRPASASDVRGILQAAMG
jgi:maleylacetate reductase